MGQGELLKKTYSGKKVFLTGHTGFKGAWFSLLLERLGAKIYGYSLAPKTENDLFNFIDPSVFTSSVFGDILHRENLEKELLACNPDFIFHLAAQPIVRESFQFPVETFMVNSIGTANLLDAARKLNIPCVIVIITTDKVYENFEWVYPYRENDRLGGYDPYSASKACTEIVTNSFRLSFFNPEKYSVHQKAIATARAGNVIGGGDWTADRIVPDVIRSLKNKKPVTVRNPKSIRPWQHVIDPLLGYLLLGANMVKDPVKFSNAWNFGPMPGEEVNVEELVKTALAVWGTGSYETPSLNDQPHEANFLKLDITKAICELQWHPLLSSKEAVEETVNWYKEFEKNPSDILNYSKGFLKKYFEKI